MLAPVAYGDTMSVVQHYHSPNYDFWKCDGCGTEQVADQGKSRVRGWVRVQGKDALQHYCPKCWEVF